MRDERAYWLGFNLIKGIGSAKMRMLLEHFGDSAESAWQASEKSLYESGIGKTAVNAIVEGRPHIDLDVEWGKLRKRNYSLLTTQSKLYPQLLLGVSTAPPVLYQKGRMIEVDQLAVAVVGTRRATGYGRQMAREITAGLVNRGVTIVSGMARGIDSVAHTTALEMNGRTVAVLGSGLDHVYPPENRRLAERIAEQGALITEYPINIKPDPRYFPSRNRIISGMTLATIVIEAAEKSGSLITSKFAMEQGRAVYALPGNVNQVASRGTNRLIQQGAKLIISADDVLDGLNLGRVVEQQAIQMEIPMTPAEARLLPYLREASYHVDELSRLVNMSPAEITSTLTMLELKGAVQQVSGMQYIALREQDVVYKVNQQAETESKQELN